MANTPQQAAPEVKGRVSQRQNMDYAENYEVILNFVYQAIEDIKKKAGNQPSISALSNNTIKTTQVVSALGTDQYAQRTNLLFDQLKEQAADALQGSPVDLSDELKETIDRSGVLYGMNRDPKKRDSPGIVAVDSSTKEILAALYSALANAMIAKADAKAVLKQGAANREYTKDFANSLGIAPPKNDKGETSKELKYGSKDLYELTGGSFSCAKSNAKFSVDDAGNVRATEWNAGAADTFAKVTINQALRKDWDPTTLNGTDLQMIQVTNALIRNGMNTPVKIHQGAMQSFSKEDQKHLTTALAVINNRPRAIQKNCQETAYATLNNIRMFDRGVDIKDALRITVANMEGMRDPKAQHALYNMMKNEPFSMSVSEFTKQMPDQTRAYVKALIQDRTSQGPEQATQPDVDPQQNAPNVPR